MRLRGNSWHSDFQRSGWQVGDDSLLADAHFAVNCWAINPCVLLMSLDDRKTSDSRTRIETFPG